MKVGLLVNVNNFTVDPATLGAAVEETGFESLWVGDHPIIPFESKTKMPTGGEIPDAYAHLADPLVALSLAAGATSKLKLGTGALILPVRQPMIIALQAATLDYFSGGRLLLGVGAGWIQDQIEILGGDYERRLSQTKEYVASMRALWADPEEAFEGKWVSFPKVKFNPRPATPGGPKVHLGTWGDRAPARVAAWGDGWLPMLVSPEELSEAKARLIEECEKIGRDPAEIEITLFEYDKADRDEAQATLGRFEEAGADRVVAIQGLGDKMGSNEGVAWGPETFREQLEIAKKRYL
jgi:probable F420-dependent oxidoreductase